MKLDHRQLNIILIAIFFGVTAMTFKKWFSRASVQKQDSQIAISADVAISMDPSDLHLRREYEDQERLARHLKVDNAQDLSPAEVDLYYEKQKYDRVVEALRTRHSHDLRNVMLEGLDYTKLPQDSRKNLEAIAEEEGLLSLFKSLNQ